MEFPIQPIKEGRFIKNGIVDHLLTVASQHGVDMNKLAMMDFSKEERMQFAQLIGYSVGGYGSLSYVDDVSYKAAVEISEKGLTEEQAKIQILTDKLNKLKSALRGPMEELFGISLEEDF